jgi:hypothetical protein
MTAYRTHDSGINWRQMNPSQGVYDFTALYDSINALRALGVVDYMVTVFGTPSWAARDQELNAYGQAGGSSPAANRQHLADYITAMIAACNGDGVRRITHIECGNEPKFVVGDEPGFWNGSAIDLVQQTLTVYDAVQASVDPAIQVLSPGFRTPDPLEVFLATQDPVSGRFGRDVVDALAWHPYESIYNGPDGIWADGNQGIARVRRAADAIRAGMDIYITEYAPLENINLRGTRTLEIEFAATAVLAACFGVKGFYGYSYDGGTSSRIGNLLDDVDNARAIFNSVARICGKTITSAVIQRDGQLRVIADGEALYFGPGAAVPATPALVAPVPIPQLPWQVQAPPPPPPPAGTTPTGALVFSDGYLVFSDGALVYP